MHMTCKRRTVPGQRPHYRAGSQWLPCDVRHDCRTCAGRKQQRGPTTEGWVDPSVARRQPGSTASRSPGRSGSGGRGVPKEAADTSTRRQRAATRPQESISQARIPRTANRAKTTSDRSAVRSRLRCPGAGRHLRRQERGRPAAPAGRARSPAIHLGHVRREQHGPG